MIKSHHLVGQRPLRPFQDTSDSQRRSHSQRAVPQRNHGFQQKTHDVMNAYLNATLSSHVCQSTHANLNKHTKKRVLCLQSVHHFICNLARALIVASLWSWTPRFLGSSLKLLGRSQGAPVRPWGRRRALRHNLDQWEMYEHITGR